MHRRPSIDRHGHRISKFQIVSSPWHAQRYAPRIGLIDTFLSSENDPSAIQEVENNSNPQISPPMGKGPTSVSLLIRILGLFPQEHRKSTIQHDDMMTLALNSGCLDGERKDVLSWLSISKYPTHLIV
jgi:hypothetical protein